MFEENVFRNNMFGNGGVSIMECMKKRFFQLAVILVAAAAFMPFHLTNDYLRSSDFDTVTIKQNDSVWSLAARYTTNEKRAAELRQAIIEVNGLAPDGSGLRLGQQLQVPVLGRSESQQVAEK